LTDFSFILRLYPVALHPSCVASKQTRFDSPYLIYHERVKTTRVYLRDATPVSPCALLIFGMGFHSSTSHLNLRRFVLH